MEVNSTFAPLALFVYNRPVHTEQVLNSLLLNPELSQTELFVFCDGPRQEVSEQGLSNITATRKLVKQFEGAKKITVTESDTNRGLASSIISGVSNVISKFSKVIVLEDDIVVSPTFLKYMNEALSFYENNPMVGSIHAYTYPLRKLPEYYFLRGGDCWGWGTWKRAWDLFNPNGIELLEELKRRNLIEKFDYFGGYLFSELLQNQINGKNDSWAVRWHAKLFLENILTLYPGKSFVQNIGNDNSGANSPATDMYAHNELNTSSTFDFSTLAVSENVLITKRIGKWFLYRKSFLSRAIQKMYKVLKMKS